MKKYMIEITFFMPLLIWFIAFVSNTNKLEAEVSNTKADIQEIKLDVKYIKNYLMESK